MSSIEPVTASYVSESEHWYARDGSPCYEVVGKNGALRPTTLRDARLLGLVPAVSTIAKQSSKPALEFWKEEQRMLAAMTLPRPEGENDTDFCRRVREDGKAQAKAAAARGSAIHGAIESYFKGEPFSELEFIQPVMSVRHELDQLFGKAWRSAAEQSFANPLGFGGKLDLTIAGESPAVIDYKCKEFTTIDLANGKRLAWDEHCIQLAAYRFGLQMPSARCVNIFVSRNEPGLVVSHEWPRDELERGWEMFAALLQFWKAKTCFDPSFK